MYTSPRRRPVSAGLNGCEKRIKHPRGSAGLVEVNWWELPNVYGLDFKEVFRCVFRRSLPRR